jgi:hypothetical protein
MTKLEESLIDKLTPRPEVRENARALLRTVHSKTGPGTGHDIGEAKIGLPAICAYIASKRYALSTRLFSPMLIAGNTSARDMLTLPKTSRRRRLALNPEPSRVL